MTTNGDYRPLRVLSLGAGVQSTTVLLMSLYGDLPPLDAVIFADTGWEPRAVYEHLAKLEEEAARYKVTITRVTAGSIWEDHLRPTGDHLFIRKPRTRPEFLGRQRTTMPFYVLGAHEDRPEDPGIVRRTCTKTYKVEPVEKEIRRLLGLAPGQHWPKDHAVDQVFGISWDESERVKTNPTTCITNVYPLIERRLTRAYCHRWLADHSWSAPRSACIGCPFHRNVEWRHLRDDSPGEFAQAVSFDEAIRARQRAGLTTLDGTPYLHDQRVPLAIADLDEPEDPQLSLFGSECEGMCGT